MSGEGEKPSVRQVPNQEVARARFEATSEAAKQIIERQRAEQDAKTERLRAARLARDAKSSDSD